jgi:hypothetical protein
MIRVDPNVLAVLLPLGMAGMACYFVPSLIAYLRSHRSVVAIFALNLLLGWTGVGWIGVLIWAMHKPLYY